MSEKIIWDYLMKKIGNPYGVAGLMGNLYVESKLNPTCLQGSYAKKFGINGEEYTKRVDNKSYVNFVNDSAGYGLAQWTHSSRKQLLLNFAQQRGASIGDLDMQLDYLWQEIQMYTTVINTLKSATSVREASDVVVKRYEKPKHQEESYLKNRADFGQKYYAKFTAKGKMVHPTTDKVNVRVGNGLKYRRILQANKIDSFEYVGTIGNWHAIVVNDQVGWISADFTKVE